MVRTMTLAASVSALALAACGEDVSDDAAMSDDTAVEESGMASANSSMADGSQTMAADERRAEADARMDGGMGGDGEGDMTEGSDMGAAAGDMADAQQNAAMSDFTYSPEGTAAGMSTSAATYGVQQATDRVLGMTREELEDFEPDAEAYARAVAMANRYQVEAGRIAANRGGEPGIRDLGEDIQEIHSSQLDSLRSALQTAGQGMQLPTELDDGRRSVVSALEDVTDVNFDPVFVRQQTSLHEALNTLHQAYAEDGAVEALVTFAEAAEERTAEGLERIRNDHEAALVPD